jgi:hypothetical protein
MPSDTALRRQPSLRPMSIRNPCAVAISTTEPASESRELDDRFSAEAFARLGLDSDEAASLAIELEQLIGECIFSKLKEGAEHVVARLNELGHRLVLDEEQTDDPMLPIGISYRDETEMSFGKPCKLRVAFDLTVSCGYAHLDEDELEDARVRKR